MLDQPRNTLADELLDKGYQTASFGKIHFSPTDAGSEHNNMESLLYWRDKGDSVSWNGPYWGFEHVELTIGHTAPVAHYGNWFRQKGGTADMLDVHPVSGAMQSGVRNMPESLHDSTFVAERTAQFIAEARDKSRPFFVVASFPDPHHPFTPPRASASRYPYDRIIAPVGSCDDLTTRPIHYQQHFQGAWHREGIRSPAHPYGIEPVHQRELIAHTYAMVDLIDKSIGTIIETLESEDLMDDTMIIFTSDHGELLGDHGLWFKGPFYYEGLLNVPLLIYSKEVPRPFVSTQLISTVDIMPTICELLGLPVPVYANGISQYDHLTNPGLALRDFCLVEYRNGYGHHDCSSKALITKDYKYVRYQTGVEELTDLSHDPHERFNIAQDLDYKPIVSQMKDNLLDTILATECKLPKQLSHA